MPTVTERVAVLETRDNYIEKELSEINTKIDGIDDFLKNGFTKKIQQTVCDEIALHISKPLVQDNGTKKNIASKIWQNENFWKMANRGMVITLFMIFMIVCALLGIDLTSQKSIILKLLGIG